MNMAKSLLIQEPRQPRPKVCGQPEIALMDSTTRTILQPEMRYEHLKIFIFLSTQNKKRQRSLPTKKHLKGCFLVIVYNSLLYDQNSGEEYTPIKIGKYEDNNEYYHSCKDRAWMLAFYFNKDSKTDYQYKE